MDPRYISLANNLTGFSCDLQKGDKVLIDVQDIPDEMTIALVRAAREKGAIPFVDFRHSRVMRELFRDGCPEQFEAEKDWKLKQMEGMAAYIAIRGSNNVFESSDVPAEKMKEAMKILRPVLNHRVNKTKWVVLRWPSSSMAQQAGMSTEAFEDFYFRVCCLDYSLLKPGMAELQKAMNAAENVHIKAEGTDLRFSLKGLGSTCCGGDRNIPDGEVYSAPVIDSVEGKITYNAPSVYMGDVFDSVCLEFNQGKIINATCSGEAKTKKLNQILDSDKGARYIGEFAIGFNPHIKDPIGDILFDEKIAGSLHFTPGQAYEGDTDNGNKSQVHWDLVQIQRPEYGGGEIWFDGELIRKDGLFVKEGLTLLNPDELLKNS